jgi:DNA-binding NarL/FixJ family response regulator
MNKTPVEVLLIDIYLGGGKDGFAATRELVEKWPGLSVAVMSASLDARVSAASTRAGARVFLPKAMPVAEMVGSIRRLAAQSRESRRRGRSHPRKRGSGSGIDGLSQRERQVLDYIRVGRTNREIAARLGVSVATVNKHVHEVLTVLNVRNRTEAAAAVAKEQSS